MNNNDCFNTPEHVFKQLNNVFSFELDAACDSTNVKCEKGFRFDMNECGLSSSWGSNRVFCNPPFSQKDKWIQKAITEVEQGECPLCVMVLPLNCMSAEAFYTNVIGKGYLYEILKGRIQFIDNQTKETMSGNNTGTVIVYFKKKIRVAA